jgi:hypothetical protein
VVFAASSGAPVPVTPLLKPVPTSTELETTRIVGTVDVASGRVLVHVAPSDQIVEGVVNGEFDLAVDLTAGRNDLLVLVLDSGGRAVAGDVLVVVRQPTGGTGTGTTGFADTSWAFTRTGQVSFRLPDAAATRQIGGRDGWWVRARISAGGYGSDARYDPAIDPATGQPLTDANGNPVYRLTPATFAPPALRPLTLSASFTSPLVAFEHVLSENDFEQRFLGPLQPDAAVLPFVPGHDQQPTWYLGFQRAAAEVGFANTTTTLYVGMAESLYQGPGDLSPGASGPPVVVWEYWSGTGWAPLGTRDETQGLTRPGLVTFIGPANFRASVEFGREAFWLRARWERGSYTRPPWVRRVLTNTIWATQSTTAPLEILGSSTGEPGQTFRSARTPVLPGQAVEVREQDLPTSADQAVIRAEEGADAVTVTTDVGGQPAEVWVRWHQVTNFHESDPRSRHYTLDRSSGEVRFGNGTAGLVPPPGRTNVRMSYHFGGGAAGNRPVGGITQLKTSVPYVVGVANLESATGGTEQETPDAVRERGPRTVRHRNRAVAVADFDDLALEASAEVARVRTMGAASAAQAGLVALVVVPRSTDPRPIPSLRLLSQVADYLGQHAPPTIEIQVTGPSWLRVTVDAEIVPESPDAATNVHAAIVARLQEFLHPLTGGLDGQGWDFGRQPYRSDLLAVLEAVPGVDHVRRLGVAALPDSGDSEQPLFLVYSGDHQITMTGESGGDDGPSPA